VIVANLGAVVGRRDLRDSSADSRRRKGNGRALALAWCVIPLWAYGKRPAFVVVGAFLMQAGARSLGRDFPFI